MLKPIRSVATATIGGLPVVDLAVALALGAYAFVRVSGEGSFGAAFGVLAMTLPVASCRRAPVAAAAVLAVGGVLSGVLFGSLVRCGTALPAVFIVAFVVAAQRERRRAALGLALCVVNSRRRRSTTRSSAGRSCCCSFRSSSGSSHSAVSCERGARPSRHSGSAPWSCNTNARRRPG